jgi:UDP-glucose 4-epimerase
MHILVTGGAGFIGSHLAEHHLKKGDKVHVIDDLSTGSKENLEFLATYPHFRFDQADILTWTSLDKSVGWADRIYHMAAVVGVFRVMEDPVRVLTTNIPGTERILRAVRNTTWKPRIILASTSEVYGPCCGDLESQPELSEDFNLIFPANGSLRWNYSISKLADEAYAISYHKQFGAQVTAVRFFNTIGPRQTGKYGMIVPRLVNQAVKGEPLTVFGDGLQTRCFCDVRDTVNILDRLAESAKSVGEIVNVGNDRVITMKGLAELIKERAASDSPITLIPYDQAYGGLFEDIRHRKPSLIKMKALSGFSPSWTLEATIDGLIAHSMH